MQLYFFSMKRFVYLTVSIWLLRRLNKEIKTMLPGVRASKVTMHEFLDVCSSLLNIHQWITRKSNQKTKGIIKPYFLCTTLISIKQINIWNIFQSISIHRKTTYTNNGYTEMFFRKWQASHKPVCIDAASSSLSCLWLSQSPPWWTKILLRWYHDTIFWIMDYIKLGSPVYNALPL
jgi:hypothetical protein